MANVTMRDIAEKLGVSIVSVSVSYTHLDVYKRQDLDE